MQSCPSLFAATRMGAVGGGARTPAPRRIPTGDAASGKQLFMNDGCSYCHGTVGQGGGGRTGGLRIAQMPIPFAAFLNQLRHPANEMPPYVETVVSDQDASDIYAYIKGLPPPPDVKTIPALNALDE